MVCELLTLGFWNTSTVFVKSDAVQIFATQLLNRVVRKTLTVMNVLGKILVCLLTHKPLEYRGNNYF